MHYFFHLMISEVFEHPKPFEQGLPVAETTSQLVLLHLLVLEEHVLLQGSEDTAQVFVLNHGLDLSLDVDELGEGLLGANRLRWARRLMVLRTLATRRGFT